MFNQMVMAIMDTMVTTTTMTINPTMPMSASPQATMLPILNPAMALPHRLPVMALPQPLLNPVMVLPLLAMTLLQLVMILLQQDMGVEMDMVDRGVKKRTVFLI
jgi:hypothetical protein